MVEEKKPKESFRNRWEALKLAVKWTYRSSPGLTILMFFLTIFTGLLTIIEPYIFKIIIDKVVSGTDFSLAAKLGIGIFGLLIVYGISRAIVNVIWDVQLIVKRIHAQKLDRIVAKNLIEKVSSLDIVYFENPEYYNTLTKANDNFWRINESFWMFTFFIGQLASVLVIVSAMFTFNWIVVALIIAAAVPSIILASKASNLVWSAFDASSPISREASYYRNLLIDNPHAVKEIKLFGLKPHFVGKFENLFNNFHGKQEKAAKKELLAYFFIAIIEGTLSLIAAWLVVRAFIDGKITIGEVTFYWALLFQFAEHARHMVRMIGEMNKNSIFITPFVKILKFEPKIREVEGAKEFPAKLKTGIEFRNVTFSYPRAKKPSLRNFNLKINAGESIALVGENGSGKTTLVKLLTRLYDVDEGEILIEGTNIKNYSLKSLYENIGVIFQDFMKYEGLIEENIGYGRVEYIAKKKEIHKASINAEAWEFIKDLEKKYETHVGKTLKDEGVELSVGQWQKIALARAFFKNAEIICLDEPTAAVDARAEYELFKKFEKLTKGKTTILISHRFSTVRMADKIILLEKGKLVEQGTHNELLRKNGRYAKLFRMQAEGYREDSEEN